LLASAVSDSSCRMLASMPAVVSVRGRKQGACPVGLLENFASGDTGGTRYRDGITVRERRAGRAAGRSRTRSRLPGRRRRRSRFQDRPAQRLGRASLVPASPNRLDLQDSRREHRLGRGLGSVLGSPPWRAEERASEMPDAESIFHRLMGRLPGERNHLPESSLPIPGRRDGTPRRASGTGGGPTPGAAGPAGAPLASAPRSRGCAPPPARRGSS